MLRRLLCVLLAASTLLGWAPDASAAEDDGSAEITDVNGTGESITFAVAAREDLDLEPGSVVVTADEKEIDSAAREASGAADEVAIPARVVYLVVDTSGSMAGTGIEAARQAGLAYLDAVPADVRIGLITFADDPQVVHEASTNRRPVRRALRNLAAVAGGDTALYDAVSTAAAELDGLPANAEKRLLVLSDGADTASEIDQAAATRSLRQGDVTADVVSFNLPQGDQAILDQIAQQSDGSAFAAGNSDALSEIFVEVAQQLRPRLHVEVKVPAELAGETVTLGVTARDGDQTVSATRLVRFPNAGAEETSDVGAQRETIAPTPGDWQLWALVALVFAVVFLVSLVALYTPVLNARESTRQSRLREVGRYRIARTAAEGQLGPPQRAGENSALTKRALDLVDRTMRERGIRDKVGTSLETAGIRMRPEEWAVLQVAGVLAAAAVIYVVVGHPVGLLIGGILAWAGFRLTLTWRTNRRREDFMAQVPETLQLIAGSLRAGFSLQQALGTVVREGTKPTASEFTRALTEARLGADLEDALDAVATRMRCQDLSWVVMAIRISREVGGNLAEVLSNTVGTMRERAELRGLVRVLSSEGRLSAKILLGLPFVVGIALSLLTPGYLAPLYQTVVGWVLLAIGAVLLAVGAFWLSRITKIEV